MTDDQDAFVNPYTFVSAHPRDGLPDELGLDYGDLADEDPLALRHDRLHRGRWTGSIGVILTVRTPLLLLDTARAEPAQDGKDGKDGHLRYPVLMRDGRPHLPATAVKGMLRSAYETITNSRLGVFGPYPDPLGWRRTADTAQRMRPAIVSAVDGDPDRLEIRLCEKARLPAYGGSPITYPGGKEPEHGDHVQALIGRNYLRDKRRDYRLDRKGNRQFGPWTVRVIQRAEDPGTVQADPGLGDDQQRVVTGRVCVTGRNAVKKKHKALFFDIPQTGRSLDPMVADRWKEVAASYADAHTKDEIWGRKDARGRTVKPGVFLGDEPGKLAWSPHLWSDERRTLASEMLCHAETRGRNGPVIGVFPVTISRDVSTFTPEQMVHESLRPAADHRSMSMADRVFGWVAPDASGIRTAAYRGRLRIGPVTGVKPPDGEAAVRSFHGTGLPLAILGQPKPGQGRFYFSESPGDPSPLPPALSKQEVYRSGGPRGLRGRKVYWHHVAVDGDKTYWDEPAEGDPSQQEPAEGDPSQQKVNGRFREFRRPRTPDESGSRFAADGSAFATTKKEQRDSQNRSVAGWVNPGVEFRFRIDVRDLSEVELGALGWLITLPEEYCHRLGLGKPLGFGSVSLAIDADATRLYTGEQWASYYQNLTSSLPVAGAGPLEEAADAFDELQHESKEVREVFKEFLAAAYGVAGPPIHYPRVRPAGMGGPVPPDPQGQAYAWFTANEKAASGRRRSLPGPLDAENPLTIYPE